MKGVFVSYRRSNDTKGVAGRIKDRLSGAFGEDHIFFDVDSIEPGDDWRAVIESELDRCTILLAIVGPNWIHDPRLHESDDVLRFEIERALARELLVVPVLVNDAPMPERSQLPHTLEGLSARNVIEIRHEAFAQDIEPLITRIRTHNFDSSPAATATRKDAPLDLEAVEFSLRRAETTIAIADEKLVDDPTNARLHAEKAAALILLARLDEAEAAARVAILHDGVDASAYEALGEALDDQGRNAEALEAARMAVTLDHTSANAHAVLASALSNLGRVEEATEALERALGLDAKNSFALATRSMLHWEVDEHSEALRWAERAVTANKGRVEGYVAKILALASLGRIDEAILITDEVIFLYPRFGLVHSALAILMLLAGDLERAEQAALQGVELSPDRSDVHRMLSIVWAAKGDFRKALRSIDRAIEMRPKPLSRTDAKLLYDKANALIHLGDDEEGEDLLEDALALAPKDREVLAGLARLALNADRLADAREYLERAEEVDPADPNLRVMKAELLFREGSPVESARILSTVVDETPDDMELAIELIWMLWESNEHQEACSRADDLVRRFPTRDMAIDTQAWAYLRAERFAEAKVLLEQHSAEVSRDPSLVAAFALALTRTGDSSIALEVAEHAIDLDPSLRIGYEVKVLVLQDEGRHEEAAQLHRQLQSI